MTKTSTPPRFGLDDIELLELNSLRKRHTADLSSLDPAQLARLADLAGRSTFTFWPEEKQAAEVEDMLASGFFLDNPSNKSSDPLTSTYFDKWEEIMAMRAKGGRAWTIIDGDGGMKFLVQGLRQADSVAVLFEDPTWESRVGNGGRQLLASLRSKNVTIDASALLSLIR